MQSDFLFRKPNGEPILIEVPKELQVAVGAGSALASAKKSKRNNRVANAWNKLTHRVRKDIADFPELSFGKLRKTGSQLVWHRQDSDTAALYLAHGQPCEDDLLTTYANRPFVRLFTTLTALGEQLKPVWDSVSEPFGKPAKGGPNITRATIERIQYPVNSGLTSRLRGNWASAGIR